MMESLSKAEAIHTIQKLEDIPDERITISHKTFSVDVYDTNGVTRLFSVPIQQLIEYAIIGAKRMDPSERDI